MPPFNRPPLPTPPERFEPPSPPEQFVESHGAFGRQAVFEPHGHPFEHEPDPFDPFERHPLHNPFQQPVVVEEPPVVLEAPPQQVTIQTSVPLVFAWRDGENGPSQPPGVYEVPPDVATAYIDEGWAVLVAG